MIYSWLEGGSSKDFVAAGLAEDDYSWTLLQGLNTNTDPLQALDNPADVANETTETLYVTPATDVPETTPFRLEVTNAAGDLDERLVARTRNLTVVDTRELSGSVFNVLQNPINGAKVTVIGATKLTDTTIAGGTFSINVPDVPGVAYRLRVTADGYVTKAVNESDLDSLIVLKSAGGMIEGTVTNGGAPLADANVVAYLTVYDEANNRWVKQFTESVKTDGSGDYTIYYEEYGQYTVVATKLGYERNTETVIVLAEDQDASDVDIALSVKTVLSLSTQEYYDDAAGGMLTVIRVAAQPEFDGDQSDITMNLAEIDLDEDGVPDTTN